MLTYRTTVGIAVFFIYFQLFFLQQEAGFHNPLVEGRFKIDCHTEHLDQTIVTEKAHQKTE